MELKPIVKGLSTFVPGNQYLRTNKIGEGNTASAIYCYNVWIKHLTMLCENGVKEIPSSLGEIGPGGSLGVGLAAMLSGVDHYYALDVKKYSNTKKNLKMLSDLVDLFKSRASRNVDGWPNVNEYLDKRLFPSHILTNELLSNTLSDERINKIREALNKPENNKSSLTINHIAPWSNSAVIKKNSIDLIISHSVMEHVYDIEMSYKAMADWIKPGGFMSHQIDMSAHGVTSKWNGYRQYPDFIWKMIVGKKPYLINREPCSKHLSLIKTNGFSELCCMKKYDDEGIERSLLSSRWKNISDDDLRCRGLFIQVKR